MLASAQRPLSTDLWVGVEIGPEEEGGVFTSPSQREKGTGSLSLRERARVREKCKETSLPQKPVH